MRTSAIGLFVVCTLGACAQDAPPDGLTIVVQPLTLPAIGKVCYDLRVTNAAGGGGDVVWARGTPGLNGGTTDPDAVCSDRFGNNTGGDVSYVGSCDADGPLGQRMNSVTLWFDGLYDDDLTYIDPAGPDGWRDPCPDGCKLDVLCEENADNLVAFDFTVLREANQGFFDVVVNFEDIFCSAKLDTCYDTGTPDERPIDLLHGADGERDWTAVVGLSCTAGSGDVDTRLRLSAIAVTCGQGPTATTFEIDASAEAGNNIAVAGGETLHYGIYRGAEALACDDVGTPGVERCNKVYLDLALSLDDLAALGTCRLAFSATATDGDGGFVDGVPVGVGVTYPYVDVDATLTPATCQANALDDGGAVSTVYYGNIDGVPPPVEMCHHFDGVDAVDDCAVAGVNAFGEFRPALACAQFTYNGPDFQQYCFGLKGQTLCIGQNEGGFIGCEDIAGGVRFTFQYDNYWPMRFTANDRACQNYNPAYLGNLANAIGYEHFEVLLWRDNNGCPLAWIDDGGLFAVGPFNTPLLKPYIVEFTNGD